MTVLTEQGRAHIDDLQYGRETAPIDTIAVGTGTAPESVEDTELDNKIYESNAENANVSFNKVPGSIAKTFAAITIRGGYEVPAETEITEIGIFADDVLIYRDVQNPQIVDNGIEVMLRLQLDTEAL